VGRGRRGLSGRAAGPPDGDGAAAASGGLVSRQFLDRPSIEVAPDLLGCVLEHETAEGLVAVALTEVEAYAGAADPASHAYRGRTARNAVMFGPSGFAYVYFTYGMHFCVNVVCMPAGTASAVLLRAGKVIAGEELARRRRAARARGSRDDRPAPAGPSRDLARGPARLCQALGIDRVLNGADLCVTSSPLRLRAPAGGTATPPRSGEESLICAGPRVGVREGALEPWRFWLKGEPTVSVYKPHVPRRR
jgi:DNA-3-methyladenine glycosylase